MAFKVFVLPVLLTFLSSFDGVTAPADSTILVDNFEADTSGEVPDKWKHLDFGDQEFQPIESTLSGNEKAYVAEEDGNKFLRLYTYGEALRITMPVSSLGWNLSAHPVLSWRWRALRLPLGAREDKVNDSGGALYVTFDKKDWLGRPYSIKYVYSTTLPVGTVVSHGNVKVIVASSAVNGTGHWEQVERNVEEDYRRVFGGTPPRQPFAITLWSDSDNTTTEARVDFDDIAIIP